MIVPQALRKYLARCRSRYGNAGAVTCLPPVAVPAGSSPCNVLCILRHFHQLQLHRADCIILLHCIFVPSASSKEGGCGTLLCLSVCAIYTLHIVRPVACWPLWSDGEPRVLCSAPVRTLERSHSVHFQPLPDRQQDGEERMWCAFDRDHESCIKTKGAAVKCVQCGCCREYSLVLCPCVYWGLRNAGKLGFSWMNHC